jgi:DNA-binding response OmpR family regulator
MRDIIITKPSTVRILVAEDDALIMRMVTAVLERDGYTVVPAHDGGEAYRILRTDADFVAAILDMNMPHLKGLDVIAHMQTERRLQRIPVMMMTAERDLTLCSKLFSAGAALFIQKPFTPAQMQIMLRLLVSKGAGARYNKIDPAQALAA